MPRLRDKTQKIHVKNKVFPESSLCCGTRSLPVFNAAITFQEALLLIKDGKSAELCGGCLRAMKSWEPNLMGE